MDQGAGEDSKGQLVALLRGASVADQKTGWIQLNRLWFDYDTRSKFTRLILEQCTSRLSLTSEMVFVCPEGVVSSFGIVPLLAHIADAFKCRMAIWKELGDIVMSTPRIFPDASGLPHGLACILFQDVLRKGTTLRKMYPQLHELGWRLQGIVGIVQIDGFRNDLMDSINECRAIVQGDLVPLALVSDGDLR